MKIANLLKSLKSAEDLRRASESNPVLAELIRLNFAPQKEFALPESYPEGRASFLNETNLMQEARRFYIFKKDNGLNLKPWKREQLFIEMCEGLSKDEAEILIAVKDQKLHELYPILSEHSK